MVKKRTMCVFGLFQRPYQVGTWMFTWVFRPIFEHTSAVSFGWIDTIFLFEMPCTHCHKIRCVQLLPPPAHVRSPQGQPLESQQVRTPQWRAAAGESTAKERGLRMKKAAVPGCSYGYRSRPIGTFWDYLLKGFLECSPKYIGILTHSLEVTQRIIAPKVMLGRRASRKIFTTPASEVEQLACRVLSLVDVCLACEWISLHVNFFFYVFHIPFLSKSIKIYQSFSSLLDLEIHQQQTNGCYPAFSATHQRQSCKANKTKHQNNKRQPIPSNSTKATQPSSLSSSDHVRSC